MQAIVDSRFSVDQCSFVDWKWPQGGFFAILNPGETLILPNRDLATGTSKLYILALRELIFILVPLD